MNAEQKEKVTVNVDLLDLLSAPLVGVNPLDLIRREALRIQLESKSDPADREPLLIKYNALNKKIEDKVLGTGY